MHPLEDVGADDAIEILIGKWQPIDLLEIQTPATPDIASAWYTIGISHYLQAHYDKAIDPLKRYIELTSNAKREIDASARVALARALVNRPEVLLLDEPLGALDLKLRKQMQLELKRIQTEVGITFVHVTHDQEEAMTMADGIAIMNAGRIEQLGAPSDLYENPKTAFVASFLGISNRLAGTVTGPGSVRLDDGTDVRIANGALNGRTGKVAVGVRPEKIRLGHGEENKLTGRLIETAYVGVATQYVIETRAGNVSVYVQNSEPGARDQAPSDISWSPDSTFVVDSKEGAE